MRSNSSISAPDIIEHHKNGCTVLIYNQKYNEWIKTNPSLIGFLKNITIGIRATVLNCNC